MSVVALLGAGSSRDAGLPTSVELTDRISTLIQEQAGRLDRRLPKALNFVVGALLGHEGVRGRSPFERIDIERVMSAVELLAQRRDLELAPFVYAWHPSVEEIDRPPWPSQFGRRLSEDLVSPFPGRVDDMLRAAIRAEAGQSGRGAVYAALLEAMTESLVAALTLTADADLDYLRPLLDLAREQPGGLTVGSLNYDLVIESVAASLSLPVWTSVDDFMNASDSEVGVRLIKLHGSIGWREHDENHSTDRTEGWLPQPLLHYDAEVPNGGRHSSRPAVIFGGGNKLRADGPYIDLFTAFARHLEDAHTLIVVGCSFRDEHVNALITRWMNRNRKRRMVVVDPSFPSERRYRGQDLQEEFVDHLWSAFAGHVAGGTAQPAVRKRLHAIRAPAADGMAEAVAKATNLTW